MEREILLSHNLLWMRPITKTNHSKDNEPLTKGSEVSRKSAALLINKL